MSGYTPKTENVRLGYSYRPNLPEGERHHPPLLREFDRWLAEHDAALVEGLADEMDDQDWWTSVERDSDADKVREWLREKARQRREEQSDAS